MHFEVVFDLVHAGYRHWWFPASGLSFVALGTLFVLVPRRSQAHRGSAWFFLGFALVWTVVAFAGTLGEYILARNALISGQTSVTEGVVTDFRPVPWPARRVYEGDADERFAVSGKHFSYSDHSVTAGFNTTRSHGGPIDNGVYVRITHRGNAILRLEIAR